MPLLKASPLLRRQIAKVRTDNIALKNGTNVWLSTAESPSQRASITVQDQYCPAKSFLQHSTYTQFF